MTESPQSIITMDKKGSCPPFSLSSNKTHTPDSSSKASAFSKHDGGLGSQVSKVQQKNPSRSKGNLSSNSNYSRNEFTSRSNRPPMQKGGRGNWDKRGKPKGGTATSEPVANRKDEPGSLQSPGGKKQNFDDLWGFRFAPRENRDSRSHGFSHGRSHPPGGGNWRGHNMAGGRYGKDYAKHFLLANCQFLVRMGEDYTVYLADPNMLVNWELIEHVRIRIDGEMPKCPICLDFPIAAKITKCGHIYCWPCFLHYLALSDNKVRTCPICYESVSKDDLKSVSVLSQQGVQVGSEIEMQLMMRLKDTSVAVPFEKFEGWETMFCKILQVAPQKLIESVITKEREELDFVFCSEPDAPEVCFIQEALEDLTRREASLLLLHTTMGLNLDVECSGLFPVELDVPAPEMKREATVELDSKKKRNDSVSSGSSCGLEDQQQARTPGSGEGYCCFYQIRNGHNVFLHPLNMAMLWRELGPDPEKWPQILTFKVIDVESKSATDIAKKRMKSIRHLPKNAPFDLVEVSMEGWGISPEVFADFSSQINQREQRRQNRVKEEKFLERKQREKEAMEFNKLQYMPQISSPQEFPAFELTSAVQDMPLLTMEEEMNMDGAIVGISEGLREESAMLDGVPVSSFAQIAGKAPLKKSPTFPIADRPRAIATVTAAVRQSESDVEGEDYVPVPNYRASMSDAIERAMAGLNLNRAEGQNPAPSNVGGSKRKKSNKGKVLFATGMGAFK